MSCGNGGDHAGEGRGGERGIHQYLALINQLEIGCGSTAELKQESTQQAAAFDALRALCIQASDSSPHI